MCNVFRRKVRPIWAFYKRSDCTSVFYATTAKCKHVLHSKSHHVTKASLGNGHHLLSLHPPQPRRVAIPRLRETQPILLQASGADDLVTLGDRARRIAGAFVGPRPRPFPSPARLAVILPVRFALFAAAHRPRSRFTTPPAPLLATTAVPLSPIPGRGPDCPPWWTLRRHRPRHRPTMNHDASEEPASRRRLPFDRRSLIRQGFGG